MDEPLSTPKHKVAIPQFLVMSFLTIFSIGAQYFINISYLLSQGTIQSSFGYGSYAVVVPTVLSYIAFATFLVLGQSVAKKFGLRKMYLFFVLLLFCGSLSDFVAPSSWLFDIGRLLQGAGSGALYMVMVPLVAVFVPTKRRNWFIFIILSGLFGATGLGSIFGGLALSADTWRWLFILSSLFPLSCLILGYAVIPKQSPATRSTPLDKWGIAFLFSISIVLIFPLMNLQRYGIFSTQVWPFLLLTCLLFIGFILLEVSVKHPLIPFHLLIAPKPFFGLIMTIAANVAVTCSLIGVSGYLINIDHIHFLSLTQFFIGFFVGTVISGLLGTWLYDKLGAGLLGLLASAMVLYVGFTWSRLGVGAPIWMLAWQLAILGIAFGLILVTGSLGGTLAAKDLFELPALSMGMQYLRNLFSAMGSPVFGYLVLRYSVMHYDRLQSHFTVGSPFSFMGLSTLSKFFGNTLGAGNGNAIATYLVANQFQNQSLLYAYQGLFTILFILGIFMFLGAVGLTLTGKGIPLAQEEDPLVGLFTN